MRGEREVRAHLAYFAVFMILLNGLAAAATVDEFGDGGSSANAALIAPGCATVVNITLPAGCHVLGATMKASTAVSMGGCAEHPENVSVRIGDRSIWEFNYTDFGPLGRQDSFLGHQQDWTTAFGPGGGANWTSVRLPKGANVKSATVEISGTGPTVQAERASMVGNMIYGCFGTTVSDAGDINGDGYDDIIAGAPFSGMGQGNMETGYAGLFFGGRSISPGENVYLKGPVEWGHMGVSVSRAGDVNGDGYDDVIVGADEYVTNSIGHAYIFFGGAAVDSMADVTIAGEAKFDSLGGSVSGAGDVNGDGYDDVIVGARMHTSSYGYYAGRAYILLGGPNMDNVTDVVLDGNQSSDFFGCSVSGAGDLNGDGYDDVVVGANGAYGVPNEAGYAAVFLGGPSMDNLRDLVVDGKGRGDALGISVSGAGDVNGDGHDDFIVGASLNDAGGEDAGAAYIFFGNNTLDNAADMVLSEYAPYDRYGTSVADARDMNNDGYDDIIVGAPQNQSLGMGTGSAYLYFGGANMDPISDAVYIGPTAGETFGTSVSGAGDVDLDGFNETVIGMPRNCTMATNLGVAKVFGWETGIQRPSVKVGGTAIWGGGDYFNTTASSGDFSWRLNELLRDKQMTGNDAYGNSYVDLPVEALAEGKGALKLGNLSMVYNYTADIADFAPELNDYLAAHRAEKDCFGNLTVPVKVLSRTPGNVKLSDLRIATDEAPAMVKPIPDIVMDEDNASRELLCLLDYFRDDFTAGADLKFGLSVLANASIVRVTLENGTNISADASAGPQNDNWTGTVELVVAASDGRGSTTVSDPFLLIVQNVPDPPVVTSMPTTEGLGGRPYSYNVTADDGDNDPLAYELLRKPDGMTVGSQGQIRWTPLKMGRHNVSLAVSDGIFSIFQNFSIEVPNSPPRVANSTIPAAYNDSHYSHIIEAVDDNGDDLDFSLLNGPGGLSLGAESGRMDWDPTQAGQFPVSVSISDGQSNISFDFELQVLQGNRAPVFLSQPEATAVAGVPYTYRPLAVDRDGDAVSFSLAKSPAGMTIDASTGRIGWTPAEAAMFQVVLMAADGRGAQAFQDFNITVGERVGPTVELLRPAEGEKVHGTCIVSGRATNGSLDIAKVQLRVDDGPWMDATGIGSWQFTLDTTKLKNGNHTLWARAFDSVGPSEPVGRTVRVANGGGGATQSIVLGPALALAIIIAAAVAVSVSYLWLRKRTVAR